MAGSQQRFQNVEFTRTTSTKLWSRDANPHNARRDGKPAAMNHHHLGGDNPKVVRTGGITGTLPSHSLLPQSSSSSSSSLAPSTATTSSLPPTSRDTTPPPTPSPKTIPRAPRLTQTPQAQRKKPAKDEGIQLIICTGTRSELSVLVHKHNIAIRHNTMTLEHWNTVIFISGQLRLLRRSRFLVKTSWMLYSTDSWYDS